jgi:beta-galactosidase/beta-glucuronidase
MNPRTTFFILSLFIVPALFSQTAAIKQIQLTDFELQSSEVISIPGSQLSVASYQSPVYWFPVKVPSTVLTGLVANRVYPDPYSGMNNMLIPDASDSFNRQYDLEKFSHLPNVSNPWKNPYWYRTTFLVPAGDKGRHFQLVFKGINYRAALWVNGRQIADSSTMAGMFAEYFLDVTSVIKAGEVNALAVKIYPLDYPGLPAREQLKALDDFYENGGPTGDIGKNVTMLCSVGWDWIPPVRDRNIGIWQPVYLRTTGNVTISRPRIITELPALPDTSTAKLSLGLTLTNHDPVKSTGKLTVVIKPENFTGTPVQFFREVVLEALATRTIQLNSNEFKELLIRQPHLWWPLNYGKPNLYRCEIQFASSDGITDRSSVVFGIRTVSSKAVQTEKTFHRDFYVNGQRVYLLGGAWVPDMMLNTDSTRYDDELRLCRNANVNLLRIWGGGITPPDIFFDLADRYGLLVWSDFWVTGDTQGEFKGSPDWPFESKVFIANMTSTIYRIRNHASLLLWTGGNEGHARKELYDAMRDSIITLDGTRPFIPSSSGFAKLPQGWKGSWPDDKTPGVYSGGPYQWTDPVEYYAMAESRPDWAFKDETGIPSQPPYNTLVKIIPNLVWDKQSPFPMNDSWGYHDAATGNGHYERYYNDMVQRFGKPVSMEDFSDKMQLMNAMGYQGIFESAQHKLRSNGGVMLWKLNAAFPSVIWQIYDWYLQPNAGYYFMQRSCDPVHMQLNLNDSLVIVVNRNHRPVGKLTAEISVYSVNSELVFSKSVAVSLEPEEVKPALPISGILKQAKGISIVLLKLKDAAGTEVSRNTYWLDQKKDFSAFRQMTQTRVDLKILKVTPGRTQSLVMLQLTNPSKQVAFFARLQLMHGQEEIMPTFWTGNYITLAPGETTTVSLSVPSRCIRALKTDIKVSGLNVDEKRLPTGL